MSKIQFSTVFWPKGGQIFLDFNFEDGLEIFSLFATYMNIFLNSGLLIFGSTIVIFFRLNSNFCAAIFSEFEIFDVRFGMSVPKDIKMGA